MKRFLCSLLILSFWALYGMAQYGPGESGYGSVSLRFQGRLLTQGTCYQPAENILRCQIPEGSLGVLELEAKRSPAGSVYIRLVSPPAGWPPFHVASDLRGTVQAQYRFTIPPGTAGSRFELLFEAWTAGVLRPVQLQVILEVISVQPPTGPEYARPGYITDTQGRFSVPVKEFPDTVVSGTVTRCGIQPLPGVPVSVELIPKEGQRWIRNLGDIGAVRVSSPGYGEAVVSEFRLLSSMDITGRVQRTIDVGVVCLRPTGTTTGPAITWPIVPRPTPIRGTTDEKGEFTVSWPGQPGTTVTGRLTECTVRPLPNQEFELTPIYEGGTLRGFTLDVPGYEPVTVTEFGRISILGITSYLLGDVCLHPTMFTVFGFQNYSDTPFCTVPYHMGIYFNWEYCEPLIRGESEKEDEKLRSEWEENKEKWEREAKVIPGLKIGKEVEEEMRKEGWKRGDKDYHKEATYRYKQRIQEELGECEECEWITRKECSILAPKFLKVELLPFGIGTLEEYKKCKEEGKIIREISEALDLLEFLTSVLSAFSKKIGGAMHPPGSKDVIMKFAKKYFDVFKTSMWITVEFEAWMHFIRYHCEDKKDEPIWEGKVSWVKKTKVRYLCNLGDLVEKSPENRVKDATERAGYLIVYMIKELYKELNVVNNGKLCKESKFPDGLRVEMGNESYICWRVKE